MIEYLKSNPRQPSEALSGFYLVPKGMELRYPPQYAVSQTDDLTEAKSERRRLNRAGQKVNIWRSDGSWVDPKPWFCTLCSDRFAYQQGPRSVHQTIYKPRDS